MKRLGFVKDDAQLETVQLSLSVVMKVWSFMDCVLVTLNVRNSSSIKLKYFGLLI